MITISMMAQESTLKIVRIIKMLYGFIFFSIISIGRNNGSAIQ